MEIDTSDSSIKSTYVYANGQILLQHPGPAYNPGSSRYFYLHDRLGSVRQVVRNTDADVVNHYTYKPFGEILDTDVTIDSPFMFTGQYYDTEIAQYYLRARMYDPQIMRFPTRDPVFGRAYQPLTLHRYLYCLSDPVNHLDPSGEFLDTLLGSSTWAKMQAETAAVGAGVKGLAAGLVNTINAINTMTASMLTSASNYGYFAAASAMYAGRTMLARMGAAGLREMQLFAGTMREASMAGYSYGQQTFYAISVWAQTNPEGAMDVTKVLMGDPHPPTTPEGMITLGGLKGVEWLNDNAPEWFRQWSGEYFGEK